MAWAGWAVLVHLLVGIMAVEWEWVVVTGTAEGSVVLSVVDTEDTEEDSVVDLALVPVVDATGDGADATEWMGFPYRWRCPAILMTRYHEKFMLELDHSELMPSIMKPSKSTSTLSPVAKVPTTGPVKSKSVITVVHVYLVCPWCVLGVFLVCSWCVLDVYFVYSFVAE